MMKFRQGDKVKFLNERGGGVVSKIVNPNLVHVTIEDGFDIPVLPSELIKIEEEKVPGRSFFNEDASGAVPDTSASSEVSGKTAEDNSGRRSPLYYGKNAEKQGVYIAFSPVDQRFLISGEINFYILNNTPYDVYYSLYTKEGDKYFNKDGGTVFAEEKVLIDSIDREDLPNMLEGFVQMLFQQEAMTEVLMPLHAAYKVQGSKFYQENAFKKSQLVNERAIVVTLSDLAAVEKVTNPRLFKPEAPQEAPKPQKPQKPLALIDRHKSATLEAEVDLHISALKEDYSDMSNGEILNFQISYFSTTIESAIMHQYNKVVYIHGIGNGTLKSTLRKKLKEEYPDFIVRNAPFARYGNGAIEVLINHE